MSVLHLLILHKKVFLSLQNPPYTMYVESFEKLSGNARFEGFALDLAEGLSKILGFNYTFKLVDDGSVIRPFKLNIKTLILIIF